MSGRNLHPITLQDKTLSKEDIMQSLRDFISENEDQIWDLLQQGDIIAISRDEVTREDLIVYD